DPGEEAQHLVERRELAVENLREQVAPARNVDAHDGTVGSALEAIPNRIADEPGVARAGFQAAPGVSGRRRELAQEIEVIRCVAIGRDETDLGSPRRSDQLLQEPLSRFERHARRRVDERPFREPGLLQDPLYVRARFLRQLDEWP